MVIAVVSSAFPYWLEMVAIRRVRAATYGVLLSIEPAVAALAALDRARPAHLAAGGGGAMAAVMAAAAGASWTSGGAAEARWWTCRRPDGASPDASDASQACVRAGPGAAETG